MKGFKKVIATTLVFAVLFSPLVPYSKAEAKVMWGNQELVKGQIGRVTMLKDASLYNIKNNKLVAAKKYQKVKYIVFILILENTMGFTVYPKIYMPKNRLASSMREHLVTRYRPWE